MRKAKKARLEARGWRVGTAAQFLGLSRVESELVEMKLALAGSLRQRRSARKMTQVQLARLVGSSQSRVAKMEAADPTVTLDLLVRSLLATGANNRQVGKVIGRRSNATH
jgi:DNA-binding XRE family transcriptional regulator